jgi:hypothetical protein
VLTLGLGIRFGWFQFPAGVQEHLSILANPYVLGAAGLAYLAEFFADKIPWVDSTWDAFHTFIRPIGAAVLATAALGNVDPVLKMAVVILCGGVALSSHSSKAATRLAVNHSPEPFSNIAFSVAEEIFVPFGVWLSVKHPALVLALVLCFICVFVWISPKVFRMMRLQLVALGAWLVGSSARASSREKREFSTSRPEAGRCLSLIASSARAVPRDYARVLPTSISTSPGGISGVRCAAAKHVRGLRNSIGYLIFTDQELLFVARRFFKYRLHRLPLNEIQSAEIKRGLLMNRLVLNGDTAFFLFKDIDVREVSAPVSGRGETTAQIRSTRRPISPW